MKKFSIRVFIFLSLLCLLPQTALAADMLIPVGRVIGLELKNDTVTVAGFESDSCAKSAGLQEGDCLLRINDNPITCTADVRSALTHTKGSATLTVRRGQEQKSIRVSPTITADGPKLGVYLKEGVTGIGTVTWYDPDSQSFAALGHGVNIPKGGLLNLTRGSVYDARIVSVRKGKAGTPGQLMGAITNTAPMGSLRRNTSQGVFGTTQTPYEGTALPVAKWEAVQTGKATILSNISGQCVQEYSVEILKIYPASRNAGRNMLIRITDPDLLAATGGIVQGMSGSPLVQDGKLIGAVTHVLVNDPTMGYGIFIENMLEAAG